MKETTDAYERDRWVKHRERALEHKWYSIGRMDVLMISISAGGLYTCFELIKFIKEQNIQTSYSLLKPAAALFALALIFNFFSQYFASFAHANESKWSQLQIAKTSRQKIDTEQETKFDERSKLYTKFVDRANAVALGTMLGGIILLAYFLNTAF